MMNENKRFDENDEGYKKLIEACLMCEQDYLNDLHLDKLPDFIPSKRHQKKMQRLIKNPRRPQHRFWRSAVGKAAAIIIAVFLALGSFTVTAEALGFPVFGYIETAYEKFIELFVDRSEITEYPTTIEEVYTLTGLPEGFVETECTISEIDVKTSYSDGEITIKMSQYSLKRKMTFDIEYSDYQKIEHKGKEIYYLCKGGVTIIVWNNGRYQFDLIYNEEKTIEEMASLSDTLTIKTN